MTSAVTGLQLHNLTEDTLEDMIEVMAKARVGDEHNRRLTNDEAMEYTFLDPDFDPAGAWLASLDGKPVGFGSALIMKNRIESGMDDAYLEVDVLPENRLDDVGQILLQKGLEYVRSNGVGKALHRCLAGDDWTRTLLESNSFKEDYRVYTLCRNGRDMIEGVLPPEGFRLERRLFTDLTDEETAAIVEVLNDSFQDHFNFAPELPERFINFRNCSEDPRAITLAMRNEETVGLCLSEESAGFNREKGARVGWVDIVGVRPRYRRLGLGRALLVDGINWILGTGMDKVYLGVLALNEKALDLYLSFGFSKERESIWYSRAVDKC
jgi:mycothiol synthase